VKRLLFPLTYWRVKHPVKFWFDIGYPAAFAVLFGSALTFTSLQYNVVGERGLVETFNGLLGILIGFFIAALAAVATFDRPGMDAVMRGEAATLKLPEWTKPLALTRRMYLCLLFGYLTFVTLVAYMTAAVVNVLFARASPDAMGLAPDAYAWARVAFIYLYAFALGHILSHTLLGVYYLAWRAVIVDQQPDESV
jgi:hypothetical protein